LRGWPNAGSAQDERCNPLHWIAQALDILANVARRDIAAHSMIEQAPERVVREIEAFRDGAERPSQIVQRELEGVSSKVRHRFTA